MKRDKLNPQCVELAESVDKLTKAARKAVIAVDDHSVYSAPTALSKHAVELWPAFLRATDAYVYVLARNIPTASLAPNCSVRRA